MRNVVTLFAFLICGAWSFPSAQGNDEMLAELRGRLDEFEKRQSEHDATSLSMLYAKDCDVNHDGVQMNGRDEVMASWKEFFEDNPEAKFSYDRDKVALTIVDPDTAIESGQWQDSNKRVAGLPTSGNYTCVYKRIDGELLIIHERAWPDPTAPLSSGIVTADQPMMPEKVRQQLDRLVGDWVFEIEDGGRLNVVQRVSARWADGDHCIEYEGSGIDVETDAFFQAKGVIGYDALQEMAIERSFSSDGETMAATFDFSDSENWPSEFERIRTNANGQWVKETNQRYFRWKGKDQFDLVFEVKAENENPKQVTIHCRRKLVSMPENVAKMLDKLSGTWETTTTVGESIYKGAFTAKWQPGRNVMICNELIDEGRYVVDFLVAWDKESQRLVEKGFTSTGGKWEAYWNTATDGKWTAVDTSSDNGKVERSVSEMTFGDGKASVRGSLNGKPMVIVRTKKD